MEPPATTRSIRLALVAFGLLVLLGVVAFASRSGLGHQSQAKPSPAYVSYAFSAFLILFILAIPIAVYGWVIQAREGKINRKGYKQRTLESIAIMIFFGCLAVVVVYLKRHGHSIFNINPNALKNGQNALKGRSGHRANVEPRFEWTVLWIAIALLAIGGGWLYYNWRASKKRRAIRPSQEKSVADDLAASIGYAIDDLEAEPDARRAVIAAYARMEAVLAGNGLRRRPSETPVEYLRRILLGLTARGDSVRRLTALFEQAKFSRHEIDATMKHDAIEALRDIRADLQGAAA